jgi:hypothetical protein
MRRASVFFGALAIVLLLFLVPMVPMQVLIPSSDPTYRPIVYISGYGSVTYYLFGFGATLAAGNYRVIFGA